MRNGDLHVTDEQLLLHSSGELPTNSSAYIRTHLERCPQCGERLEELESTLAEVAGAHTEIQAAKVPPMAEARAQLQARLTELSSPDREHDQRRASAGSSVHSAWVALVAHRQTAVLASVAVAACLLLAVRLHTPGQSQPLSASLAHWEEPDQHLTPGATLPLTRSQVCGAAEATLIPAVPVSLKRKVFEEYGVTPPRPDAYEVDYLITPELGGATDIRNLWPEPYQETVWNAHVKDQLEERLHQMVCRGDVDLATAQRDISADWIAAYRKYFHTDTPLSVTSSTDSSDDFAESRQSPPLT
jgi:hypothetical protein